MMQQYPILIGKRDDGKYIRFEGTEHVALYAASGSGKTSGFVIPACLTYPGSLVVLDIKGEAFNASAGYRQNVLGQDVYVFDPAALDGRSHRWNPLAPVERDSIDRFDQISRQAYMLFPEATSGSTSNSDAFWTPSARGAFSAVATLLAETPGQSFTMSEVLRHFARGDAIKSLVDMVEARRRSSSANYSRNAVDGISDYINGSQEQVDGIRKMASVRIAPWFNPRVAAATAASDFDLRDLRRRPMTIYVRVQPGNIPRMRPVLSLFFDALVNLNTDVIPEDDPTIQHQVLVILDEFARLGRMESLAEAAQYVRGYGMRFAYVIQNTAQLRAKYGPDGTQDILDNTGAEIVFGTKDPTLTKELSERMGDDTIDVVTRNRPRFMSWLNPSKQSEAIHPHRRPLMLAQEIMRMDRTEQIVLRTGLPPMKMGRPYWKDDPKLRSRGAMPPPIVPQLDIGIDLDDGSTQLVRKDREKAERDEAGTTAVLVTS